jgi:hypothetical protein
MAQQLAREAPELAIEWYTIFKAGDMEALYPCLFWTLLANLCV